MNFLRIRFQFTTVHLFPGQGIQKVRMTQPLFKLNPEFTELYRKLVNLIPDLSKVLEEGPQELINQTQFAQPAIFIHSYIHYLANKKPANYAIGHSVGEYSALNINGYLKPEQTVKILWKRGNIMVQCSQGKKMGMLAVLIDNLKQIENIPKQCQLSLYNSPKQVVFSGEQEHLKQMRNNLKQQKIKSSFLEVSTAFHNSILTKGKDEFRQYLRDQLRDNPEVVSQGIKVIRNVDCRIYQNKAEIIEGLTNQLDQPVRFWQSLELLKNEPNLQFYEYGSKVLSPFVKHTLPKASIECFCL